MSPLLFSGARGLIQGTGVDGLPFTLAVALNVNVARNYSQQQTFTIGRLHAASNDPTGIDVSVSIGTVMAVNQAADSTKPLDTSPEGLKLKAKLQDMLKANALTLSIIDQNTQKVIASVRECRENSDSLSASAQSVGTRSLSFVGIMDTGYDNKNSGGLKLGYGDNVA